MPDVRVVCFDWGGVIIRICRNWREGCERAGLPIHEAAGTPEAVARRRAINAVHQVGRMACEDFFASVAHASEGLYTPEQIRRIHDAWLIEEYPRIGGVIDRLNATKGITTALLSNTNASHWARQHAGAGGFGAAARLKVRLASHEMGLAKPDEAIYHTARERFGVPAEQIVFFDDLPENIDAARSAGWRACLIDPLGDTSAQIERHLAALGIDLITAECRDG
ncbi:MAG: HAD family hydrolase [Leptolyngbya sp. PLA3]|nr:MAG: HAD family hydrolase [Cyanobacteria bacterium CYA]MCE7967406.1 HAD family hydrolase [Leptolyngbya sp. PL-A3]